MGPGDSNFTPQGSEVVQHAWEGIITFLIIMSRMDDAAALDRPASQLRSCAAERAVSPVSDASSLG